MALGIKGKQISLDEFSRNMQKMEGLVAINDSAYKRSNNKDIGNNSLIEQSDYTLEEINSILKMGSSSQRKALSVFFFKHNSLYKRILLHYVTFLTYQYLLVPHTAADESYNDKKVTGVYDDALDFLNDFQVETKCAFFTYKILVEGGYYGLIKEVNKRPVIIDLPFEYCRSRFKNDQDIDIVEFDLKFFDTIRDEKLKKQVLDSYPKYIQKAYRKYKKNMDYRWIFLPAGDGIHFSFYDEYPFFLDIIPLLDGYDNLTDLNKKKREQEVEKILVQKIPITTQGELVFDPPEAEVIHKGTVKMLSDNIDITTLTSYADVHLESLQDNNSAENNYLQEARKEIFGVTGTSDQIFTPDTSGAIPYYLQNTLSFMRILSKQYQHFLTTIINKYFSNTNIKFNIIVPPISHYNSKDFIADAFKLASSGYSFFMPCMALGVSQRDLRDLKVLEGALSLRDLLEPLHSSYTESGKDNNEDIKKSEGGAPVKDNPTDKTIKNKENK